MVEFQEPPLVAPAPVGGDEGASVFVARDGAALHVRGDVPRRVRLAAASARPSGGGELPSREIGDEKGQRAVEDLGEVTGGNRVPEQVLCDTQLLAHLSAGREADLVPLGRQRADYRARDRGHL